MDDFVYFRIDGLSLNSKREV